MGPDYSGPFLLYKKYKKFFEFYILKKLAS